MNVVLDVCFQRLKHNVSDNWLSASRDKLLTIIASYVYLEFIPIRVVTKNV